jgi:hypothetical protein
MARMLLLAPCRSQHQTAGGIAPLAPTCGCLGEATSSRMVARSFTRRSQMTIGTILLIVLILLLIGAIPSWPHSRSWGYGPSGILGVVLVVVIVLLLMGRL